MRGRAGRALDRLAVAACVAAVAVVAGCARKPSRVKIGIGLARSGHAAVQLAAEEINASGGIDGVPVELMGLGSMGPFSEWDPSAVLGLAEKLAADEHLLGVIGHSDSASTLSTAPIYNRAGIPQIVTIATNPAITNIGPWTYRLCLSDDAQGPLLADYAVKDWKKRRIAMFAVSDDYGRALSERFERRVRELGGTLVRAVSHRNFLLPDDHEMIRSQLADMKADPPDLIVLFQRVRAARWTIRAIREAGLTCDILGGDNLASADVMLDDQGISEGMRVSQFLRLEPGDARAAAFERALRAKETGREVDYDQAFAYDAVHLLRDAIRAGGFTRSGIKDHLDGLIRRGTVVKGVAGEFRLGPDHDARRPIYIAEIRNRRFHIIGAR